MRINFFFLLICLLATTFLGANNPSILLKSSSVAIEGKDTCDLPAPFNFRVEDIGPTWVKLAWGPASPLIAHHVRTYKAAGNVLVSDLMVPAGQLFVVVQGLQQGVSHYSTVHAVCPDGTDSKYGSSTPDWDTIITELIVNGINQSNNSSSCGVSSFGQYCEFPLDGSISIYKVRPISGSGGRQFNVVKPSAQTHIFARTNSNLGQYIFKVDGQFGDLDGTPGQTFQAYNNGTLIATFELIEHYNNNQAVGRLIWTSQYTGYEIVRLTAGPNGLAGPSSGQASDYSSSEREANVANEHQLIFAAPNPFSKTLKVFLPTSTAQQITLQLFNLSGQKVLDQQFPGGQEQYSLSTAGLSTGFYLLRIEADGEVQTLKVIKSE